MMQSAPSTGQNSTSSRTASCEAEPLGDWSIVAHRFKTRMCRTWETTGACLYTSRCMFAHGPQDLRTAEQNLEAGLVTAAAVRAFQHRRAKMQQQQQSRQQESSTQPQQHGADMARSKRPKRTNRGPNGRPPHHRAETSHYDATSSAMVHDAVPPQAPPQLPMRAAPATTPKNQIAPIAHMPRTTLQTLPMGHFSDLPAPRISDSPPRCPSLLDHSNAQVLPREQQQQQQQQHHHDVSILGAAQACSAPLARAQGNDPRDFHHGGPQQSRVDNRHQHQQDALHQEVQDVQPVQSRHVPQVRQPPPRGYQPTQPVHDVLDQHHQPQPQSMWSPPQQRRYPASVCPTDNRCSGRGDQWPCAPPIVAPTNASVAFDHGHVQAALYGPEAQSHEQVYGMHGQVGGPVKEAPPPPLHHHRPYDHNHSNHHAACRCAGCIRDATSTGRVPVEVAVMLPPPPAWQ